MPLGDKKLFTAYGPVIRIVHLTLACSQIHYFDLNVCSFLSLTEKDHNVPKEVANKHILNFMHIVDNFCDVVWFDTGRFPNFFQALIQMTQCKWSNPDEYW